ncbi:MAG TPA: C1 family peptidase [Leptospiraceae bacterium]|nr:C1 family peptidase [Leptospiraceae bacterium]HMY65683.1 C1 family peptidase [Leptospiraceae bacterium]HNF14071.1 C1 family peptidase [Leptospiraceae bacterium]HNF25736.1 C1 family peptidase [Leptospiraceae bacterium]HNM03531.1 C1 family peptidase [Leptospiraceae bacterium]
MLRIILIFGIAICSVLNADDAVFDPASVRSKDCESKGNCGYIPLNQDQIRSIPKLSRAFTRSVRSLPASVDLSGKMPPVGSQGTQSSCVAWATAYAMKSYQEKVERDWNYDSPVTGGSGEKVFSPAFIYNQINGGYDQGSRISDALQVMISKGAAPWKYMPYTDTDYRKQPSAQAFQEAAKFKGKELRYIQDDDIDSVKAELSSGNPVVFGIPIDDGFYRLKNQVYDRHSGKNYGGHAMTLVGYDDNKVSPAGDRGAFKIINSWGTGWGDRGYGWISYRMFVTLGPNPMVLYDIKTDKPADNQVDNDIKLQNPASVQASNGTYRDRVILSWDAVPGVSAYAVFRKDPSAGDDFESLKVVSKNTGYTDTSVIPDRMYIYKVVSYLSKDVSSDIETAPEASGYAKSEQILLVPEKVTGLLGSLKLTNGTAAVHLQWNSVGNASSYEVVRWDGKKWNAISQARSNSFSDSSPTIGRQNYYCVRARNSQGAGKWSDMFHISAGGDNVPAVPAGLSASMSFPGKIELRWSSVPGASLYVIKRFNYADRTMKEIRTKTAEHTDTDSLIPGAYFSYTVCAGNSAGYSEYTPWVFGKASLNKEPDIQDIADEISSLLSRKVKKIDPNAKTRFTRNLNLSKDDPSEFFAGEWKGKFWDGGKNTQEFSIKVSFEGKKFTAEFRHDSTVKKITGTTVQNANFLETEGFRMKKVMDKVVKVSIHSHSIYPKDLELSFTKD